MGWEILLRMNISLTSGCAGVCVLFPFHGFLCTFFLSDFALQEFVFFGNFETPPPPLQRKKNKTLVHPSVEIIIWQSVGKGNIFQELSAVSLMITSDTVK